MSTLPLRVCRRMRPQDSPVSSPCAITDTLSAIRCELRRAVCRGVLDASPRWNSERVPRAGPRVQVERDRSTSSRTPPTRCRLAPFFEGTETVRRQARHAESSLWRPVSRSTRASPLVSMSTDARRRPQSRPLYRAGCGGNPAGHRFDDCLDRVALVRSVAVLAGYHHCRDRCHDCTQSTTRRVQNR